MRARKAFFLVGAVVAAGASLAPAARAQTLNQLGVSRLNEEAQTLWSKDGLKLGHDVAIAELNKLVGKPYPINKKTTATITKVNSVTLDCAVAPGLERLDGGGVAIRVPRTGEWRIEANVDVHVKGKILGIKVDRTIEVNVEIKELSARSSLRLDSSDPAAPKIVSMTPPIVLFKQKVKTSSWGLNFVLWLTRGSLNALANEVSLAASLYITAKFNLHPQGTPQVIGAGGPPLAPVRPADLEKAALRLEDQIFDTKLPYGSVFEVRYDKPFTGTWEESFNDPQFDLGNVNGIQSHGDSALMHGHLLAAVASRYAVTRDAGAARRARMLLASTRMLLTMKGKPGDLNRSLLPRSSPWAPTLGSDQYYVNFQGQDWVASDYISRDAYMGTFYGLSLAHDLIDIPSLRDDARQQLEMAIDYLLANDWTWRKRDGSFGERWLGTLEQQWAWVLAAHRVNPAKYAAAVEKHKGYADLLWCGIWIGCLDPYYSYYKFHLAHGSLHTALRLETDPVRFQRAYQGMAIMRHYIGHHQNAHFNNAYIGTDPSSLTRLGAENKNLLTRWLRQPRRWIRWDLTQDPTIEKTNYTVPFDPNLLFPGQGVPQTVLVAKYPIPVEKRLASGYRWSTSPYRLSGYQGGPDPVTEGEGIDLVLPYWMARYYRALP